MKKQIYFLISLLTFLILYASNPFTKVPEANAGIVPLYLIEGQELSRTLPETSTPAQVTINGDNQSETWTLTEPFAEEVTLDAGDHMVRLYIEINGNIDNTRRKLRVTLTSTGSAITQLGSTNINERINPGIITEKLINISLPAPVILPAGSSIQMTVNNNSSNKQNNSIAVHVVTPAPDLIHSKIDLLTSLMPDLIVLKSVVTHSDPVNNSTNPKAIPGAVMTYTIMTTNTGPAGVDTDSFVITDSLPVNTELYFDPATGPVSFTDTGSSLLYNYPDNIDFFSGGAPYTPVPDAFGYDGNVSSFIIRPQGTFSAYSGTGTPPSCSAVFRVKIK